ncbi:hypothetical protein ACFP9V_22655 [Deinococcus radiopugnans]|uniref:Uncharacterized protein n=1 Tax=Deinococcus radiopugnans ATCC 19172 TaxID=585398 RepID=A0A5C4Y577_9DEIO|nr:hypothetical protein [Deinococcus radiopugnans]MBB6017063.1 hypothetical protein [Deinococcus radiopugnans ATCC 19172]TNM70703.1 hypothetical protein FHR04_12445 [Deinococcus radiopugnans ATCC 19172]
MTGYEYDARNPEWDAEVKRNCHWELDDSILRLVGLCPRCHNEMNYTVEALYAVGYDKPVLIPKTIAICRTNKPITDRGQGIIGCGAVFDITGLAMPKDTEGEIKTESEHG